VKVLFDTNVVLDVLLDRVPFSVPAARLFAHVESGGLEGYLCATTVTTIHYLAAKQIGRPRAKDHLIDLLKLFEVAPVNRLVLETALSTSLSDFEDAVILAAAHHAGIEALITRNAKDFRNKLLPIHSPDQLLQIMKDTTVGD
jgi:predicted nucleic acid-binding protein